MKLDKILPQREWVTLAEAATAIAFGKAITAAEFIRYYLEEHEKSLNDYLSAARSVYKSGQVAGNFDECGNNPPNLDFEADRAHIKDFINKWPQATNSYDSDLKSMISAVDIIIEFAAQGKTRMAEIRSATGNHREIIPAFAIDGLKMDPSRDLSALSLFSDAQDWSSVLVERIGIADLDYTNGHISKEADANKRRGKPPKHNWEEVKKEMHRLLEENSDFSDDDPEWNAQERLVEALQEFIEEKLKSSASANTIRAYLKRWRDEAGGIGTAGN